MEKKCMSCCYTCNNDGCLYCGNEDSPYYTFMVEDSDGCRMHDDSLPMCVNGVPYSREEIAEEFGPDFGSGNDKTGIPLPDSTIPDSTKKWYEGTIAFGGGGITPYSAMNDRKRKGE